MGSSSSGIPAKTAKTQAKRTVVGDIALAQHEGVTTKTVANWRNAGLRCVELTNGQFQYDLDEVAAFRATLSKSPGGAVSEEAQKLATLGKRADVEVKLAKAAEIRRRQKLADGEVLDRETYELHAVEAVQKARDRFLRLPETMAKLLPPEIRDEVLDEMRREITLTLNELAKDFERGPE